MSLPLTIQNLPVVGAFLPVLLYLAIGCGEWCISIRRMIAIARGDTKTVVIIVFIENIVSLWVLSKFIQTNDWGIALAYCIGGALGALLVMMTNKYKCDPKNTSDYS